MNFFSLNQVVDFIFGLGLFFNAFLFLPQALALYRCKSIQGLSLVTFAGFNIMQFFTAWHAYLANDFLLMFGFLLSFITCGFVTFFILYYKIFNRKS